MARLICAGNLRCILLLLACLGCAAGAAADMRVVGLPLAPVRIAADFAVQHTPTWEWRLRRFAFQLLKATRRWTIRGSRYLRRSVRSWAGWLRTCAGLLLVGALASAVDLRLFRVWRQQGVAQALRYALAGAVIFARLLADRRVSHWARLPVIAALAYGVFAADLVLQWSSAWGRVDDLILIVLASRWFVRRCPEAVVQQHAARARRSGRARR